MPTGPAAESLRKAQLRLARLQHELGSEHTDTFEAEQCVVALMAQSGRHAEALTLAHDLIARAEGILGPKHRVVLALSWNIGCCTYALGDVEDALPKLDSAVAEASRALGPSDPSTVLRSIGVVRMLVEAGRTDAARERLTALEISYPDLPSWHVYKLQLQEAEGYLAAREQPTG
jgi:hypothetical protein